MATQLTCSEKDAPVQATVCNPTLTTTFQAQPGKTVTLEKVVTVFTSRDVSAPHTAAQERLMNFTQLHDLAAHGAVWDELWRDCDVVIEGDVTAQLAVRYNLFQLLAAAPRHDNGSASQLKLSQGLLIGVTCFGTQKFYRSLPDIYSTTSSTQLAVLPLPYSGRSTA